MLSDDMNRVEKWLHLNKLKLNHSKSDFIVFGRSTNIYPWFKELIFGHAIKPQRESLKYFGRRVEYFRLYSVYHFKSCTKYRNY